MCQEPFLGGSRARAAGRKPTQSSNYTGLYTSEFQRKPECMPEAAEPFLLRQAQALVTEQAAAHTLRQARPGTMPLESGTEFWRS